MPRPRLLDHTTRHLFFTGKGSVGKTSLSTACAIALADNGKLEAAGLEGPLPGKAKSERVGFAGGVRDGLPGFGGTHVRVAGYLFGRESMFLGNALGECGIVCQRAGLFGVLRRKVPVVAGIDPALPAPGGFVAQRQEGETPCLGETPGIHSQSRPYAPRWPGANATPVLGCSLI